MVWQGASILVVDDDVSGREALVEYLRDEGYAVRQAATGRECLAEVERAPPDLVLLDVSMPELDGIDTLRELRKRQHDLPVMLITGARADPDSIGIGLGTGAEAYLIKPIRPSELKVRLHALLDRSRARRQRENMRIEQMAMLVHDLRQPLSAIALRGELFADEGDTPEVRRAGEVIRGACHHMGLLIQAVLTLARRTASGVLLDRKRTFVEPLVRDVVEQLAPLAVRQGIAMTLDAVGHHVADVDELRLIQVLHNLLGNALKFTPPGGRIDIACRAEGAWLDVVVSDTGPGVAPEEAARIFERWAQTDLGQSHGGYGLGLAIVREIVQAHGGKVACEARPGRGARFSFRLPLVGDAALPRACASTTPLHAAHGSPAGQAIDG